MNINVNFKSVVLTSFFITSIVAGKGDRVAETSVNVPNQMQCIQNQDNKLFYSDENTNIYVNEYGFLVFDSNNTDQYDYVTVDFDGQKCIFIELPDGSESGKVFDGILFGIDIEQAKMFGWNNEKLDFLLGDVLKNSGGSTSDFGIHCVSKDWLIERIKPDAYYKSESKRLGNMNYETKSDVDERNVHNIERENNIIYYNDIINRLGPDDFKNFVVKLRKRIVQNFREKSK